MVIENLVVNCPSVHLIGGTDISSVSLWDKVRCEGKIYVIAETIEEADVQQDISR